MPFTAVWSCGFEAGSDDLIPLLDRVATAANITAGLTGAYAYIVAEGYIRVWITGSPSDLYIAAWIKGTTISSNPAIYIYLSDGNSVAIQFVAATGYYQGQVNAAVVATGTVRIANVTQKHHVQMHVVIANAGTIESKIEGIADITYNGDTQPGAVTDITNARFAVGGSVSAIFDDIVIGTGGWPGDLRADGLVPSADTATEEWTRSAGADSYALVDEVPPSTADYISSGVDAQSTIVSLADWDATGKTPEHVVEWAYVEKDEAAAHQIALIDQEGGTTNVGSFQDVLTSWGYINKMLLTAPDGTAWNDAHVDALEVGVKSKIV